ncbi:hypothetical protein BG845_06038 [Pseudonocardia autotrophica]|uniref:Uncharacterized protein n=1 Tax=Pseudonocardia autotrophica TaxID=2074 RepID=A0A1Y2MJS7_PSEAH|nr:hypothetical protein BG845_06038 [Pseudonocardia autotrophica]
MPAHEADTCAAPGAAPACPLLRQAPSPPATHDELVRARFGPSTATARVRVRQPSPLHSAISSALSAAAAPPVAAWQPDPVHRAFATPCAIPGAARTVPARLSAASVPGSSVDTVILRASTGQSPAPDSHAPDADAVVVPIGVAPPASPTEPPEPTTARQSRAPAAQVVEDVARLTAAASPEVSGTVIASTASCACRACAAARRAAARSVARPDASAVFFACSAFVCAARAVRSAAASSWPARAAPIAAAASPPGTDAEAVSAAASARQETSGQSTIAEASVLPDRVSRATGSVVADAPACTAHPVSPGVQVARERESDAAAPSGVAVREWAPTVAVHPAPAHSPVAADSLRAAGAFVTRARASFSAAVAEVSAAVACRVAVAAASSAVVRAVTASRRSRALAPGSSAIRRACSVAACASSSACRARSWAVSAASRACCAASRRCRTITSATTCPLPAVEVLVPRHAGPDVVQVLFEELWSAGGPRAPCVSTARPGSSVPDAALRTVPRQPPAFPAQSRVAEAFVHAEAPDTLGDTFAPAPGEPAGGTAGGCSCPCPAPRSPAGPCSLWLLL